LFSEIREMMLMLEVVTRRDDGGERALQTLGRYFRYEHPSQLGVATTSFLMVEWGGGFAV